jgi:menaquinone-dependent protoporphyrinogen IX oxidase
MKTIVVYYSRNGSNRYLSEKIAGRLNCDIEELKPRLNVFPLLLMKISFGIKALKHDVKNYDEVILCGPIWMGGLIPPLHGFISKYSAVLRRLAFITCCGSSDDKKNEKFGYGLVFKKVEEILKEKCITCRAFPIGLVMPEDKKEDPDAFMKTRLSDANFNGVILERFEMFINDLTALGSSIE